MVRVDKHLKQLQTTSELPIRVKIDATAEHSFETYKDFYEHVMLNTKRLLYPEI